MRLIWMDLVDDREEKQVLPFQLQSGLGDAYTVPKQV